jgi:hypothetical protein
VSNYARMLIDLLGKPGPNIPLRPDQLQYAWTEGAESIGGCKHMAYLLFMVIREQHGDAAARRIFAMWGTPPTPTQIQKIHNRTLLSALDSSGLPVQRFAKQQAKANEKLPRAEQRGAGSTDPIALEKQIRRQMKIRDAAIAKGTWGGPFLVPR